MKTYFELIKAAETPEEMTMYLLEYEMFRMANRTDVSLPSPEEWLKSERSGLSILQDVMSMLDTILGGETDES